MLTFRERVLFSGTSVRASLEWSKIRNGSHNSSSAPLSFLFAGDPRIRASVRDYHRQSPKDADSFAQLARVHRSGKNITMGAIYDNGKPKLEVAPWRIPTQQHVHSGLFSVSWLGGADFETISDVYGTIHVRSSVTTSTSAAFSSRCIPRRTLILLNSA